MKIKEAEEKGYSFTGSYERSRERLTEAIKEIKRKGYKCSIVTEPDSKLSRGSIGTGYSIYAEEKYFTDEEINDLNERLSNIEARKIKALKVYEEKVKEIDEEEEAMKSRLQELKTV